MVRRITIEVDYVDQGGKDAVMEFVMGRSAHVDIVSEIGKFPAAAEAVEKIISGGKSATAEHIQKSGVVAKLIGDFPKLAVNLICMDIETAPGEDRDAMKEFVRYLEIDKQALLLREWIGLNFERGLAPFAAAATIIGLGNLGARTRTDAATTDTGTPSTTAPIDYVAA